MIEREIEISVIVASFNPRWEKLKSTVKSVILQKGISIELIIADDGSENDFFGEITDFIEQNGFKKYTLLKSEVNQGTVKNVFRAIEIARGKYIRPISPGDYLYCADSLSEWYSFMEKGNYSVSFGEAVYYNDDGGICNIIDYHSSPKNLFLYKGKRNEMGIRRNYLQLDDMVLGAALLTEKDLLLNYLQRFLGKVRLGEDFVYKLMVFDKIKMIYYPNPVVWYEVGHGISSSKEGKYDEQMLNDWKNTHRIISTMKAKDSYARKFQRFIKMNEKIQNKYIWKIYKCVTCIDVLFWKLCSIIIKSRTCTSPDMDFYEKINEK